MNLILIYHEDFKNSSDLVRIKGRRLEHTRKVFKASVGDELTVGLLNGKMDKAICLIKNFGL